MADNLDSKMITDIITNIDQSGYEIIPMSEPDQLHENQLFLKSTYGEAVRNSQTKLIHFDADKMHKVMAVQITIISRMGLAKGQTGIIDEEAGLDKIGNPATVYQYILPKLDTSGNALTRTDLEKKFTEALQQVKNLSGMERAQFEFEVNKRYQTFPSPEQTPTPIWNPIAQTTIFHIVSDVAQQAKNITVEDDAATNDHPAGINISIPSALEGDNIREAHTKEEFNAAEDMMMNISSVHMALAKKAGILMTASDVQVDKKNRVYTYLSTNKLSAADIQQKMEAAAKEVQGMPTFDKQKFYHEADKIHQDLLQQYKLALPPEKKPSTLQEAHISPVNPNIHLPTTPFKNGHPGRNIV